MRPTGEGAKELGSLAAIPGLAEDTSIEHHLGVGRHHHGAAGPAGDRLGFGLGRPPNEADRAEWPGRVFRDAGSHRAEPYAGPAEDVHASRG